MPLQTAQKDTEVRDNRESQRIPESGRHCPFSVLEIACGNADETRMKR